MFAKISVDQALMKARLHVKKNEVTEAKKLYKTVLEAFPNNIRAQKGLISLNNYREENSRQTPPSETINQLLSLYNHGQLAVVVEQAESLTKKYPRAFVVWNFLGAASIGLGKVEKASAAFKKVTELNPNFADGFSNLGATLKDQGKFKEAMEAFNIALSIKPNHAEAYNNIGLALKDQRKFNKAIEAFHKALSFKPNYADVFFNMGLTFQQQDKLEEAIVSYNKALSINPNHLQAYNNMGNVFVDQGKFDLAIASFKQALKIRPNHEGVRVSKLKLQANICDWSGVNEDQKLIPKLGIADQHVLPFNIMTFEDSPERNRIRSERFAKNTFTQKPIPISPIPIEKPKRLRIGYFSSDFRMHSVGFIMADILEAHNKNYFEIYVYSFGPDDDSKLRKRIINSCDVFDDVKEMGDKDIALLARQDKLDIAIDLNGYTVLSRPGIFAYRAAPIQIHFWGSANSSGADFIDYYIANNVGVPEEHEHHYSESIIRLPYWSQARYEKNYVSDQVITRKDMGLPENGFVFCSFNNNYKLSPIEFDIWMRLLNLVEGSVLWLYKSNKWIENNLQQEALKRGVAKHRLVFADKVPHPLHLARQKLADVFADTFNVNAGVTAGDALWVGLPVVTKLGKGLAARTGGMMLASIDMPELITKTEQEYEDLLLDLATNPQRLSAIKKKLAANRLSTPLFNSELFTKNLENGYQQVYQRYFDGKHPEAFSVVDCQLKTVFGLENTSYLT